MHKLKKLSNNKKRRLTSRKISSTALNRYPQYCGQKNKDVKIDTNVLHILTLSINTTSYLIRVNCLDK